MEIKIRYVLIEVFIFIQVIITMIVINC
jgi:hypothetical protein